MSSSLVPDGSASNIAATGLPLQDPAPPISDSAEQADAMPHADSDSQIDATEVIVGAVKWFDVKKGFGFIVGPSDEDVFVHFSVIESDGFRTLKDGEKVSYELHKGDKGYHAQNVRRIKPAADDKPVASVHAKASKPRPKSKHKSSAPRRSEAHAERAPIGNSIHDDDAGARRRTTVDGYVG